MKINWIFVACLLFDIAMFGYFWATSPLTLLPEKTTVGAFQNELFTKALDDDRSLELTSAFAYLDGTGQKWEVPAGAVVNGASIPQELWSIVGSPLVGKYRLASVIHDYYCEVRTRPWQETHRVFYEAMLARGVADNRAKIMYMAVYRFGPRWEEERPLILLGGAGGGETKMGQNTYHAEVDMKEMDALIEDINAGEKSLDAMLTEARAKRLSTDKLVCEGEVTEKQDCES